MDNFICIITGPIGAGKSYLRYMLVDMGFEVLDLDKVSSDILHSSEGQNFIKENFGEAFEGGIFSKARLSEIVFSDREKLNKLEKFIHPKVNIKTDIWIDGLQKYGFIEVSAPQKMFKDYKTIVVNAPEDIRIQRLLNRGMDLDDIKRRIDTQRDSEWWNSLGHCIENLNKDSLSKEVLRLLKEWGWIDE